VSKKKDIVKRLRGIALDCDPPHLVKKSIEWQAADEIERLRKIVMSFPCTCFANRPKCDVCKVAAQ